MTCSVPRPPDGAIWWWIRTPARNRLDAVRKLNLDWIDIRKGSGRSYPNGQLAAHVSAMSMQKDRALRVLKRS